MVPEIFHFVFGLAPDFGGKPFELANYLSIKSAIEINKPQAVYFHYQYEPTGVWWEKIKGHLTLNKVDAPENFMGSKLYHFAHKADVIRLQALKETGGIYLDMDTISVKPMKDLLNCSFAIGQELDPVYVPQNLWQDLLYNLRKKIGIIKSNNSGVTGLCNAVMISEKNSDFVNLWLEEYKSFRSKGRDKYWNEHSVQVPLRLAETYPDLITILGPYAFHYPLYDPTGLQSMFEEVNGFPEAYVHHLWGTFSWNKYLADLTVEEVKNKDTTFNLIARRFL